jgi:hypothetical protein
LDRHNRLILWVSSVQRFENGGTAGDGSGRVCKAHLSLSGQNARIIEDAAVPRGGPSAVTPGFFRAFGGCDPSHAPA